MNSKNSTRRDFLSASVTAATAAGIATGGFFSETKAATENKKLGVALVGLGSLSTHQIAPALLKTEHCRLAAIVTGTPAKGDQWCSQYGLKKDHVYSYDNFEKIAADDTVDLVYIVLPNSMHHEFTLRAAKAGKHVLCEKPMANSSQECREMIAACRAANRQLAVGYRCQFEPHHVRMMEIAHAADFGAIERIDAGFGFKIGDPNQWRLKKALARGGALMDVGIYALQACRYLTREEPVSITAQESKTDAKKFAEVDESIAWRMQFPSGTTAFCTTSYNADGLNRVRAQSKENSVKLDPAFSYSGIRLHSSAGPVSIQEVDQFRTEMDDFARCISERKPSKVAGEEGLKDLLAIEAIYESIARRTTVPVEKA